MAGSSSPDITPKEEPVTLDRPESPNLFLLATQVEFTFDEITFTTNNEVALIYPLHSNQEYFMVVLPDSRIWVSTPTGEVRGEIGYNGEIGEKGTLKKSCFPLRLRLLMDNLGGSHSQAEQKTRKKIVPYPRFISLLLEHMAPKYDNEELTINPTQVFSVHNWILKPNQPEEPPFTDHMKAICNLDVPVDSKAPKYSSSTEEKETKSSSAMDTSPIHPSPLTLVVGEMHKEAQQAAGGPTSLGDTSEDGAYP
ncbi:hypothetical protein Tco_0783667 [Tanacetum coccineum]